jgi:ParB family chromosome partitioning protein
MVVTEDNRLIAGQRRLEAARMIGWKDIPVRVAGNLTELVQLLTAEQDENLCRLDLSPTEMVSMGKAIKELLEPAATCSRQQAPGQPRGAKKSDVSPKDPGSEETSIGSEHKKGRQLRDEVGESIGVSGGHFYRAESVVDAATENPELYGDLPAKMDETEPKR